MKNLKNKIAAALTRTYLRAKRTGDAVKERLESNEGQFVVDHAVVFVIILVVGALALTLLRTLMNETLAPTVRQKILDFFN